MIGPHLRAEPLRAMSIAEGGAYFLLLAEFAAFRP